MEKFESYVLKEPIGVVGLITPWYKKYIPCLEKLILFNCIIVYFFGFWDVVVYRNTLTRPISLILLDSRCFVHTGSNCSYFSLFMLLLVHV